jgi:hypothetical protein
MVVWPSIPLPTPHKEGAKSRPVAKIEKIRYEGLLDGRVELYPVYRRLFYGVGPFRGSVRHALSWKSGWLG